MSLFSHSSAAPAILSLKEESGPLNDYHQGDNPDVNKKNNPKKRKKDQNILLNGDISVCATEWKNTKTESGLESKLRTRLSGSGKQKFFWPEWREEYLIRMC